MNTIDLTSPAHPVDRSHCPRWCVATHAEDFTLHLGVDESFTSDMGVFDVSRWQDDRKGRHGVYVGDYAIDLTEAASLAALLAEIAAGDAR